jgi:hypothetical protein
MSNQPTHQQIEDALAVLRSAGYYVENLWHIRDVQDRYEASDETAIDILDGSLCSEPLIEHVFALIEDLARFEELKKVEQ